MKVLAIGLMLVGVLGVVFTLTNSGSARSYVKDHYKRAGSDRGAQLYTSTKPPTKVAKEIAGAHKPADRRVTPEGIFLRYRSDFVGVMPKGSGSQIAVADERRGYGLFFPFVGGYWGRASGRGEGFRGGGPGGGGK